MWRSISGYLDVEITCAFSAAMLARLNERDIQYNHIRITDELHFCVEILRKDIDIITGVVESNGGKIKVLQNKGIYWTCVNTLKRPVLIIGVLIILFLSIFLSTRILFVNIVGNETISEKYIMERAEVCGVHFGSLRSIVRSEVVKNRLLEQLPQLRWAGVNTSGCIATIIVKERDLIKQNPQENEVGNIVAIRDGVVREIVVKKGTSLCTVGQAVKSGQILVSGYTDTGLTIKAEMADGEILASTQRNISVISPVKTSIRGLNNGSKTFYCLRIGKKLINFCKDSGILDASCVKMYSEIDLILPGGFVLPVTLIKVDVAQFDVSESCVNNLESFRWLNGYADKYVTDHMICGQIIEKRNILHISEDCAVLMNQYICSEMIGQVKNEEIITGDGKRN